MYPRCNTIQCAATTTALVASTAVESDHKKRQWQQIDRFSYVSRKDPETFQNALTKYPETAEALLEVTEGILYEEFPKADKQEKALELRSTAIEILTNI